MLKSNLEKLEDKLSYSFKNKELLIMALTHSSYTAEKNKSYNTNNERLEFIGDGYLDAIIGGKLFELLPEEHGGILSKTRADIVCEASIAMVSRNLGIGDFLILGNGEEKNNGKNKDSILADSLEAVIGALTIDAGFDIAKKFVYGVFEENIRLAVQRKLFHDYKSKFQELVQSRHQQSDIIYRVVDSSGPDHDKSFRVEVQINGQAIATGSGKSKKEAEQEAAKMAINKGEY